LPLGAAYAGRTGFWYADAPPTSRVGYSGAPQTIAVMAKAALEDAKSFSTRRLAEAVCEQLDSKDYLSEYLALYYFLLQHTRYMRDPKRVELVRAPSLISDQIMAGHRPSLDCDDMATWLAAAIMSVGGQVEFCTVAFANLFYGGERQFSHVFLRATEPRARLRVVLDPVAAEKTPTMLRRVKAAKCWPVAA
jgi:hypothetical protein